MTFSTLSGAWLSTKHRTDALAAPLPIWLASCAACTCHRVYRRRARRYPERGRCPTPAHRSASSGLPRRSAQSPTQTLVQRRRCLLLPHIPLTRPAIFAFCGRTHHLAVPYSKHIHPAGSTLNAYSRGQRESVGPKGGDCSFCAGERGRRGRKGHVSVFIQFSNST